MSSSIFFELIFLSFKGKEDIIYNNFKKLSINLINII